MSGPSSEVGEAGAVELTLHGQSLVLLPERALWWREADTLLLADPHFGKAAAFRAGGIPVPRGTTGETLERLERALARVEARRLVVLGDFLHARRGRAPGTLRRLRTWRETRPRLELVLVRGNHDRHAGDPWQELDIHCTDQLVEPPFHLLHHPGASDAGYVLAGHIHPAVRLRGRARQAATLPCFHFGEAVALLPAFGAFTGTALVEPARGDRVFVIADDQVVEVSDRATGGRERDEPSGGQQ